MKALSQTKKKETKEMNTVNNAILGNEAALTIVYNAIEEVYVNQDMTIDDFTRDELVELVEAYLA